MTGRTLTPDLAPDDTEPATDTEPEPDADTDGDVEAGPGTAAEPGAWRPDPWTPTRRADLRDEPAVLDGYGPIPAPLARHLIFGASDETPVWLRRLYLSPPGRLVTMETSRRAFTPAQREFLRLRDQTCRTPWCDAPIRHTDHVTPAADGGHTSLTNGQGLCAGCNYAKQAPGWQATTTPDGEITITAPTGHDYRSRAPDPPGAAKPPPPLTGRARLDRILAAA